MMNNDIKFSIMTNNLGEFLFYIEYKDNQIIKSVKRIMHPVPINCAELSISISKENLIHIISFFMNNLSKEELLEIREYINGPTIPELKKEGWIVNEK